MKYAIALAITVMSALSVKAQSDYSTALGLRLGGGVNGISAKHFLSSSDAVEGIFGVYYRGIMVTGLWERHFDAFDVDGLNWYIGGGAHVGFWRYFNDHPVFDKEFEGSRAVIGIDGIIGLEYTFSEVPINLSTDWKPVVNLVGWSGGYFYDGAISVRYAFN
jgi:hypothetical protein